jgi:hypothetical protein
MEVTALPTSVLTEMPPVNFLKATKISLFDPMLIYLFRNHFSTWIDANNYGSQADFVELYTAFREVYKNHSKVDTSLHANRKGETLDFQALQALDDQNDLLLDVSSPTRPLFPFDLFKGAVSNSISNSGSLLWAWASLPVVLT